MPTMHEHRRNAASIATTLGQVPKDSTPRRIDQLLDAMTDEQILANAERLLRTLGHENSG
jgi:hypothetical protein